ncbi:hypothetical protein Tco_1390683 [Tanacetum coccineum]
MLYGFMWLRRFMVTKTGIVPLNSIRFKVGDGSSIRFWKDTCRLVNVGRTKAEFDALIFDIASLEPEKFVDSDTCIWSLSHDNKFSVNSVRKHIDKLSLPSLSPMPTRSSLVTHLLLFGISFVFGHVICSLPFPHVDSGIISFSHGMPQRKRMTALTPSLPLSVGPYGSLEIISLSIIIL